jgi:anti-sigma regulatory factor (Ser/Thr protein kinase)
MPSSPSSPLRFKPAVGWPRRVRRFSVAGGPRAPERVRSWLQQVAGRLPEELERNLMLLTCELVNNSIVHGRVGEDDTIVIELRKTADGVRAEVSDAGPGFAPEARDRPLEDPGGWGLVLVDRLAHRWGVEHDSRTRVWFELAAA